MTSINFGYTKLEIYNLSKSLIKLVMKYQEDFLTKRRLI